LIPVVWRILHLSYKAHNGFFCTTEFGEIAGSNCELLINALTIHVEFQVSDYDLSGK